MREVSCTFCKAAQPNPKVLVPGQEVIVKARGSYELARVVACAGPAEIEVSEQKTVLTLDDVVPVTRPGKLFAGSVVFVKDMMGWRPGVVTNVTRTMVKVKSDSFDDAFFDETVDLSSIRVRADQPLEVPSLWRRTFGLRQPNWFFIGGVTLFLGLPLLRLAFEFLRVALR